MKRFFTTCCLLLALIQLSACGALSQAGEVIQQVNEVSEQLETIKEAASEVPASNEEATDTGEQAEASDSAGSSDDTFNIEDWIDPTKVSSHLDTLSSYRLVTTAHMITKSDNNVSENKATYIEERSSDPWLLQIRTLTDGQTDQIDEAGKIFGEGKIHEYNSADGSIQCTTTDLDAEAIRMAQGMARGMAGTLSMMTVATFGEATLQERGVVVNGVTTNLYTLEGDSDIFKGNGKFWADENGMLIKAETFSAMGDVMETTFTYSLEEVNSFGPISLPESCTP
jgi:hypothetical protein